MRTFRRLSIVGLALCGTAGAVTFGHTAPISAAPTAPTIAVTAHLTTSYLPGSYQTVAFHHLALHVTGSNFAPGSRVRLAIINVARWELLRHGVTQAQPATISVICGHDFMTCSRPNPRAGRIDYRMRLNAAPRAANLLVLYRTAGDAGMQTVTMR
jgi:hypothetical protein